MALDKTMLEIAQLPEFRALPENVKQFVRDKYFDKIVAPKIKDASEGDIEEAKTNFSKQHDFGDAEPEIIALMGNKKFMDGSKEDRRKIIERTYDRTRGAQDDLLPEKTRGRNREKFIAENTLVEDDKGGWGGAVVDMVKNVPQKAWSAVTDAAQMAGYGGEPVEIYDDEGNLITESPQLPQRDYLTDKGFQGYANRNAAESVADSEVYEAKYKHLKNDYFDPVGAEASLGYTVAGIGTSAAMMLVPGLGTAGATVGVNAVLGAADANNYLRDVVMDADRKKFAKTKQHLTPEEQNQIINEFEGYAVKHGLIETGTELAADTLGGVVMKMVPGGKTLGKKVARAGLGLGVEVAGEHAGETAAGYYQNPYEVIAGTAEPLPEGFEGVKQAFKDQFGATNMMLGLGKGPMVAGAAMRKARGGNFFEFEEDRKTTGPNAPEAGTTATTSPENPYQHQDLITPAGGKQEDTAPSDTNPNSPFNAKPAQPKQNSAEVDMLNPPSGEVADSAVAVSEPAAAPVQEPAPVQTAAPVAEQPTGLGLTGGQVVEPVAMEDSQAAPAVAPQDPVVTPEDQQAAQDMELARTYQGLAEATGDEKKIRMAGALVDMVNQTGGMNDSIRQQTIARINEMQAGMSSTQAPKQIRQATGTDDSLLGRLQDLAVRAGDTATARQAKSMLARPKKNGGKMTGQERRRVERKVAGLEDQLGMASSADTAKRQAINEQREQVVAFEQKNRGSREARKLAKQLKAKLDSGEQLSPQDLRAINGRKPAGLGLTAPTQLQPQEQQAADVTVPDTTAQRADATRNERAAKGAQLADVLRGRVSDMVQNRNAVASIPTPKTVENVEPNQRTSAVNRPITRDVGTEDSMLKRLIDLAKLAKDNDTLRKARNILARPKKNGARNISYDERKYIAEQTRHLEKATGQKQASEDEVANRRAVSEQSKMVAAYKNDAKRTKDRKAYARARDMEARLSRGEQLTVAERNELGRKYGKRVMEGSEATGSTESAIQDTPDVRSRTSTAAAKTVVSEETTSAEEEQAVTPVEVIENDAKAASKPRLVGVEWRSKSGLIYSSREEGLVEGKVSDWDKAEKSAGSGRKVVHVYLIDDGNGNVKPYGKDTAMQVLGLPPQGTASFNKHAKALMDAAIAKRNAIESAVKEAEGKSDTDGHAVYERLRNMVATYNNKTPFTATMSGNVVMAEKDGTFVGDMVVGRKYSTEEFKEELRRNGWNIVNPADYKSVEVQASKRGVEYLGGAPTQGMIPNPEKQGRAGDPVNVRIDQARNMRGLQPRNKKRMIDGMRIFSEIARAGLMSKLAERFPKLRGRLAYDPHGGNNDVYAVGYAENALIFDTIYDDLKAFYDEHGLGKGDVKTNAKSEPSTSVSTATSYTSDEVRRTVTPAEAKPILGAMTQYGNIVKTGHLDEFNERHPELKDTFTFDSKKAGMSTVAAVTINADIKDAAAIKNIAAKLKAFHDEVVLGIKTIGNEDVVSSDFVTVDTVLGKVRKPGVGRKIITMMSWASDIAKRDMWDSFIKSHPEMKGMFSFNKEELDSYSPDRAARYYGTLADESAIDKYSEAIGDYHNDVMYGSQTKSQDQVDSKSGYAIGNTTLHNRQYFVNLFEHANLSTLAHESSHVFFLEFADIIRSGSATPQMVKDWNTLCDFVGADPNTTELTKAQHEKLARAFETYLAEGKAPSAGLKSVFERFKNWMMSVYRSVVGAGAQPTDAVRDVFSRMLSSETSMESSKEELAERERVREEMVQSVNDSPKASMQARKMAGSVEAYVDAVMQLHDRFAEFGEQVDGRSLLDYYRRLHFGERVTEIAAQEVAEHPMPEVGDISVTPSTMLSLNQWQNLEDRDGKPGWYTKTADWLRADGRSEEEVQAYLDGVRGQMAIFESLGAKIEAVVQGAGQAKRGNNRTTATEENGNERDYSFITEGPVRSNADPIYVVTFDASSSCVKRLNAANTALQVEREIGRPLNGDEQITLVAISRSQGKEAPCLYCYVESGRNKARDFLNTALDVAFEDKPIPSKWKADPKQMAKDAIAYIKKNDITRDDIHYEYLLDSTVGQTDEAIEEMKTHKPVYDLMKFCLNAAKSNKVKPYEEYKGEFLNMTKDQVELINGFAGFRFFSSSDFQVEHVIDVMQALWDLNSIGGKAHGYTKVPLTVHTFGDTGLKWNMSCFAKMTADGQIAPDTAQGWNWEEARKFREDHPDCGTVMVTANDKVLKWALEQDWIDYCIPFHMSAMQSQHYGALGYQDSTGTQLEDNIYAADDEELGMGFHEKIQTSIGNPERAEIKKKHGSDKKAASVEYVRKCIELGLIPIKKEHLFEDILNDDTLTVGKKRKAAFERCKAMIDDGTFDPSNINPGLIDVIQESSSKEGKYGQPARPHVRMHEMGTQTGISNAEGTRRYLQICFDRKIYPVFTPFIWKDVEVVDLQRRDGETKEHFEKRMKDARSKQTKAAKLRWKEMVKSGAIDWNQINPNAFKFKKDYARTDTPFRVVDPTKIHTEEAFDELKKTLQMGLEEKYKGDPEVARDLVRLIKWSEKHPNEPLGQLALRAMRSEEDIVSAITGEKARETNYAKTEPISLKPMSDVRASIADDNGEKNTLGVYLDRVIPVEGELSFRDLSVALKTLSGKKLNNDLENVIAEANGTQARELVSGRARDKSIANGYTGGEHNKAVSLIEKAWRWSAKLVSYPELSDRANVTFGRYVSPINVNGKDAFLYISTKTSKNNGTRIYSAEVIDDHHLRTLIDGGIISIVNTKHLETNIASQHLDPAKVEELLSTDHLRSYEEIIDKLNQPVNDNYTKVTPSLHGTGKGISSAEVHSAVDAVDQKFGTSTQVVESFDDLPAEVRAKFSGDKTRLEGVNVRGTVYLVAGNIKSKERAAQVWMHEHVGHDGFESLMSEKEKFQLTNRLFAMLGGVNAKNDTMRELKRLAIKYGQNLNTAEGRDTVMREYLARLAEKETLTDREQSVWKRLWNHIASTMRKAWHKLTGDNVALAEDEVRDILRAMKRQITEGERARKADLISKIMAQVAWHGTPFEFDRFTLDNIGGGEGAQAHGWGLYFANSRDVSEMYRDVLSSLTMRIGNKKFKKIGGGWKGDFDSEAEFKIINIADVYNGDVDAIRNRIKADITPLFPGMEPSEREKKVASDMMKILDGGDFDFSRHGQLYKVDIPDEDVMLDEQKQYIEQSENVIEGLKAIGVMPEEELEHEISKIKKDLDSVENDLLNIDEYKNSTADELFGFLDNEQSESYAKLESNEKYKKLVSKKLDLRDKLSSMENVLSKMKSMSINKFSSGGEIYQLLTSLYGSTKEASYIMNRAGIKGITYDGRRDGRCFVVFDDKSIDILEKVYASMQAFEAQDEAYLDAIERGDMDTVRKMVEEKAAKNGFTDAIPEQMPSYKVRTGAAPKKTIKVYKTFFVDASGRPSALFVNGNSNLPQNVWLDATDAWHFTAANGKQYVPSMKNPNRTKGGKTGQSIVIPNTEVRQYLIEHGFIDPEKDAQKVTALAYRPGWHAGQLPFFPQGGTKNGAHNYKNAHSWNQVVFECEMAFDKDYTRSAIIKSGEHKGKTRYTDMQTMPMDGGYRYATNPMTNAEDLGTWFISGALKIGRALTQQECDSMLTENGYLPQEWEQGEMNLADLGYTGEENDAAKKTLAPVTYDDNGNIIPLSQRFDPSVDDIRYSIADSQGEAAQENLNLAKAVENAVDKANKEGLWKSLATNAKMFRAMRKERVARSGALDKEDVGAFAMFRQGFWLGRKNPAIKAMMDAQSEREDTRTAMTQEFTERFKDAYEGLSAKGHEYLRNITVQLDRATMDDPVTGEKGSTPIELDNEQFNMVDYIDDQTGKPHFDKDGQVKQIPDSLNDAHYEELRGKLKAQADRGKIDDMDAFNAAVDAYIEQRRAYDQMALSYMKHLRGMKAPHNIIDAIRKSMKVRPFYFPHQRYGNWAVIAKDKDGNTIERIHFDAANKWSADFQAGNYIKALKEQYPDAEVYHEEIKRTPEDAFDTGVKGVDVMRIIEDALAHVEDKDPEEAEKFRKHLAKSAADIFLARGIGQRQMHRQTNYIAGFETDNLMKTMVMHASGLAGAVTKFKAAHDFTGIMQKYLEDNGSSSAKNRSYAWMKNFAQDVLRNSDYYDRLIDKAKSSMYLWYLGANIKSGAVNLTQNPTIGMPIMAAEMGTGRATIEYFSGARKAIIAMLRGKKNGTVRGVTADENRFLDEFWNSKAMRDTYARELRGIAGGPKSAFMQKVMAVIGAPMEYSERFNRLSFGLANFRAAMDGKITNKQTCEEFGMKPGKPWTYEAAVQYVQSRTRMAHGGFGKGERAQVFRHGNLGRTLNVGATFKSIQFNNLELWKAMLTDMGAEGRKAFALSMAAHMVFGGAVAIPFLGTFAPIAASALSELFGGDDDPERYLKKHLGDASGETAYDVIMYGVPAVGGVTVKGSLETSMPLSDLDLSRGWTKGMSDALMKNIFGAGYSMLEKPEKSWKAATHGRYQQAVEYILPSAFANVSKAERLYREGDYTSTGRPIPAKAGDKTAAKFTGSQAALQALGFASVRKAKQWDQKAVGEYKSGQMKERKADLVDKYIEAVAKKDRAAINRLVQEWRDWNSKHTGKMVMKPLPELAKAKLKAQAKPLS